MIVKRSLIGILNDTPEIFDYLVFPDGISKDDFMSHLVTLYGDLNICDIDPQIFSAKITIWGKVHYWTFDKLYKTLNFIYNPIWNKDGTVTETLEHEESENAESSSQITSSGTGSATSESINSAIAYDANAFTQREKLNDTNTRSDSSTNTSSGSNDVQKNIASTMTREEKGNIGVTTTQAMIKEEREVSMFNLYTIIADSFAKNLLIMIF